MTASVYGTGPAAPLSTLCPSPLSEVGRRLAPMHIDWGIVLAGAIVGFTVGLTGMGGGALMTPILVIFFGISPTAAVSSDLIAAMVMKPIGGGGATPARAGGGAIVAV